MSSPAKLPIPSAKLLSSTPHTVPGKLIVTEQWFQVPLDYANPSAGTIRLFGRTATKRESPIFAPDEAPAPKPYMVYLQGGPGFGCPPPQDFPPAKALIERGYQVLMLDHRGVGLSTPVSVEMLQGLPGGEDAQYNYLRMMRQDNTVRDCEAVRKCLTEGLPEHKTQWSIIGQSYGGFVALSYLSMHPEGLREAFLTGGLAPVGQSAEQLYKVTFGHVAKRNEQYFAKYPEDVAALRQIATYIESQGGGVKMPGGGTLTVPRLMTMGISFGMHGGFQSVHDIVLKLKASLDSFGFLSRAVLTTVDGVTPFDSAIIYAILHEAIYADGPGMATNWSAQRVGQALNDFWWLQPGASVSKTDKPLLFSGEMVFPFHFETYPELVALRNVAERLAQANDWPALYDQEQLKKNKVPVYCASYVDDMCVDYGFGSATARMIGAKTFETNMMYHNAVRAKMDEVLANLFALRDDTLD